MRKCILLTALVLWLISPAVAKEGTGFLLRISGNVKLKRYGWSNYITVGFGTKLQSDDFLQINGQATLLCTDLSVKIKSSGIISGPCSDSSNIGLLESGRAYFLTFSRGKGISQEIPYILYPRNTLILDSRPLLQWHNTGASSFTIAIVQRGAVLWKQRVVGTKLQYPADAPALQPNTDYLLLVTDNDRNVTSNQDPTTGIGFQVLGSEGLTSIKTQRDKIMSLRSLDDTGRRFALGVYYSSVRISTSGFRPLWETWQIFKDIAQKNEAPAIHLLLGDVLTKLKLPNEAQKSYETALSSADKFGDIESQASAHVALWRLTVNKTSLNKAISLYEQLGETSQANVLRKQKAQLVE